MAENLSSERGGLGSGDDEEGTSGADFLIEGEGGFLGGTGLVSDNFFDLADDQVFGNVLGGEGKNGGFGIKGDIGRQVDDIGLAAFVDVVALGAGFQLNGQLYFPVIEGDDFDNRSLDFLDQANQGVAGDDGLARQNSRKILAGKDD